MKRRCRACNDGKVTCGRCGGYGMTSGETCYYCQDKGVVECGACGGTGEIEE